MRKKKSSQCPHSVASFQARAVARICEISGTHLQGHIASHEGPSKSTNDMCRKTARERGEKSCIREKFPALGSQVHRHQPPTQEKSCAVDLLTSMSASKWRSVHWPVVSRGRARACGQQDCLQLRKRLLRDGHNSDSLCFYICNGGNNAFLFKLVVSLTYSLAHLQVTRRIKSEHTTRNKRSQRVQTPCAQETQSLLPGPLGLVPRGHYACPRARVVSSGGKPCFWLGEHAKKALGTHVSLCQIQLKLHHKEERRQRAVE